MRGKITDENDTPVPDAAVIVDEPRLHRTVRSDALGKFQIANLAPGAVHVAISKAGFFQLTQDNLQLVQGINDLSFTLPHEQEVHEKVEVTSTSLGIDPQETSQHDSLVAHDILDIPVPASHSLSTALVTLPQVIADNSDELHFAGARVDQTEYVLDGFELGDPATGAFAIHLPVDAVRVADLATGRYGAEYSHAGTGVLSLETTKGDDRWRFNTTDFIPALAFDAGVRFGNWYPRVSFSGPIRKGRAWFSDTATLEHTFTTIEGLPAGQNFTTQWLGYDLARFTVKISDRQTAEASVLYNQGSAPDSNLAPFTAAPATQSLANHRVFLSGKDQLWLHSLLVEFGVAGDVGETSTTSQGNSAYIVAPGGYSGNYFQSVTGHPQRLQAMSDVLLPQRHWHGTHDLAAGVNADATHWSQDSLRTEIETERADGTLEELSTFNGSPSFGVSDARAGAYAQDAWQILPVLRLQAGVREDFDRIAQHGLFQPRVSANYLPFRSNATKFSLGWGRSFQPLDLSLIGQAYDQQQSDVFFDPSGTVQISGPFVSRFILPPGHLLMPYFDTASVAWQQRISPGTFASVSLTDRQGRDGLAYQNIAPGQQAAVFELENEQRDAYHAAEFSLRHQFGEQSEVGISYVRSSSTTNQDIDYALGSILYTQQLPGPLPWDTPNRVISHGWTPLPLWHLFGSYFVEYHTGFPFDVVNQEQQLAAPPASMRFPNYVSLNLALEKRFRFRHREWAIRVAEVNVTGHVNAQEVINNIAAPNFLEFAGGQTRGFSLRLRLVGEK